MLSGLAQPETTKEPLPTSSITPFDSSIRSASRTDERPAPNACVSSRSVGSWSPGCSWPVLIRRSSWSAINS